MENEKQLRWSNIALIAFVAVWGLGNVVNNFALQGLSVVTSWIFYLFYSLHLDCGSTGFDL